MPWDSRSPTIHEKRGGRTHAYYDKDCRAIRFAFGLIRLRCQLCFIAQLTPSILLPHSSLSLVLRFVSVYDDQQPLKPK